MSVRLSVCLYKTYDEALEFFLNAKMTPLAFLKKLPRRFLIRDVTDDDMPFWIFFHPKIAFSVRICSHFGHFRLQKGTKSLKKTPKKSTKACIRARKALYDTNFDHKCIQKVIKCLYAFTKCILRDLDYFQPENRILSRNLQSFWPFSTSKRDQIAQNNAQKVN